MNAKQFACLPACSAPSIPWGRRKRGKSSFPFFFKSASNSPSASLPFSGNSAKTTIEEWRKGFFLKKDGKGGKEVKGRNQLRSVEKGGERGSKYLCSADWGPLSHLHGESRRNNVHKKGRNKGYGFHYSKLNPT